MRRTRVRPRGKVLPDNRLSSIAGQQIVETHRF